MSRKGAAHGAYEVKKSFGSSQTVYANGNGEIHEAEGGIATHPHHEERQTEKAAE